MATARWVGVFRRIWIAAGICFSAALFVGFQSTGIDEAVFTDSGGTLTFRAEAPVQPVRLLFLPGAMVEPKAYAPLLRRVAQAGFPVTLIKLPMRTAWSDAQRRGLFDEIQRHAGNSRWVLAGHSRGAMLSCRYVHERAQHPEALVLMGTTHPRDIDLSLLPFPITKILGTADGIAPLADSQANRRLLPASVQWIEIEGGNHTQFGNYRFQFGDHAATISRSAQQDIAARVLRDALQAATLRP